LKARIYSQNNRLIVCLRSDSRASFCQCSMLVSDPMVSVCLRHAKKWDRPAMFKLWPHSILKCGCGCFNNKIPEVYWGHVEKEKIRNPEIGTKLLMVSNVFTSAVFIVCFVRIYGGRPWILQEYRHPWTRIFRKRMISVSEQERNLPRQSNSEWCDWLSATFVTASREFYGSFEVVSRLVLRVGGNRYKESQGGLLHV
jgi:hypothetical protein